MSMELHQREKPFFSIITCTLNAEKYIEKNLQSVYNQTYANFEHIIIDGQSTDSTIKIVNKFKNKSGHRTNVYIHSPKGIWDAINLGNNYANGKYVLHLESDNSICDQNVLMDVHNFLVEKSFPDWIYGKITVIKGAQKKIGNFPERKIFQIASPLVLKFFNFIPQESVFMKKDLFKKYGNFSELLPTAMDYDMWLRIKDTTEWCFYDRLVTRYRIHEKSITGNPSNRKRNTKNQLEIQKKHLSKTEFKIAKLITQLTEKYNKTY